MTRRTRTAREAEKRLDDLERVTETTPSEESVLDEDQQEAILDAFRDLQERDGGIETIPVGKGDPSEAEQEAIRAVCGPCSENGVTQQCEDRQ